MGRSGIVGLRRLRLGLDVGEAPEPLDADDADDSVQGTFTFHNGQTGTNVTGTYMIEDTDQNDCSAFGNLEVV